MTRDELLEALLLERYTPRPTPKPRPVQQSSRPHQTPVYFTDTPKAQAQRRNTLADAIGDRWHAA